MRRALLDAAALAAAGFRARGAGGTFRRRGFVLRPDGRWAQLRRVARVSPAGAPQDPCSTLLAAPRPGPWKQVGERELFDLPPCALAPECLCAALEWALSTAAGAPPTSWKAPATADVAGWIPAGALSVRAGAFAAHGRVAADSGRLALEIALGSAAAPAHGRRAAWLAAILGEAQERWRLVRLALPPDGGPPRAEVDLSGAPEALLPELVQVAADALAEVARGLLAPVALLLDEGASSRALDTFSPSWS